MQRALFDDQRKGRPVEITDDAVAWIIDVACQRPADLGYSQELWTLKNLHQHIQNHAEEAGFPRLKTITKPMIQKILKRSDIKPFKIKYYCERRDPDFESKMHDVLVVYKQVSMQFDEEGNIIIPTHFVCSRCGAPFSENLFIEVSETLTQEPTNEHFALTGDKVDLFEIVRQVVASNIPSQALCSPNCLGVCPKCGINRNEASCKCDEPKTGNNNPFAGLMGKFN